MRSGAAAVLVSLAVLLPTALAAQEAADSTPAPREPGRPANLCQELVAYLEKPPEAHNRTSDPRLTTAVQAPKPGEAAKAAGEGAPTQAGLSGQAGHQVGEGAPGPQGEAQRTAAPQPPPAPSTAQNQVTLADAQALAASNDLSGCRDATQRLRRAGAPLPAELLALGALDLKFFTN